MRRSGPLPRRTALRRSAGKRARSPRPVDASVVAEVVLRDGGCVARGVVAEVRCWGRLDPHHVLPRGRGGGDTADNLIVVCRAHHDWIHGHPRDAIRLGLLAAGYPNEQG